MPRAFFLVVFMSLVSLSARATPPAAEPAKVADSAQLAQLDRLLSIPNVSELTRSPHGDSLAWVTYERGRRSLWISNVDGKARALTSSGGDDGQQLRQLSFSDDGTRIAYVRGGEDEHGGEAPPNPTSDPRGVKEDIWVVSVAGGEPWRVADGRWPAFAPNGKELAFVAGGQLHLVAGDRFKDDATVHVRGRVSHPRWSPDGSQLAFSVSREHHGFIAVYDVARRSITWLAPGVDNDISPVWSPDGSTVAFLRLPGDRFAGDEILAGWRRKDPFAVWIADAHSGRGHAVFSSHGADGGYAQGAPPAPLLWAADGKLVFYSEADGWLRLYAVDIAGGAPRALSPSGCEVADAALTVDRRALAFTSNCGDIDRRHVWRVSVGGGAAERLSSGSGLEWNALPLASGAVAAMSSTATRVAGVALLRTDGPQLLSSVAMPPGLVTPEMVTWTSADRQIIHGQLFLPPGAHGRGPALLFLHGGPIRQMMPGWPAMLYYQMSYALCEQLALDGYVILAPNFRGGIGYGRAFRQPRGLGAEGAAEYQDVVSAAQYLRRRSDVDSARIGVWGGSYGGYLTAMALAHNSDLFVAGVDYAGVHDWSQWLERVTGGHFSETARQRARASSPVTALGGWRSPVLFVHGDDDINVDFQNTVDLVQRLRELGKAPIDVLALPDEVHFLLRYESYTKLLAATRDFLQHHLAPPVTLR
jgi:dipeptidyl aminopeptidase/acylaminoacyl peptidase